MKRFVLIAMIAVIAMAGKATEISFYKAYSQVPMHSVGSSHVSSHASDQSFSVALLHSPSSGGVAARVGRSRWAFSPLSNELMASGSEYSSVITRSGPSLASRPRRTEENPFGDQTIDDVNTPQDPGSPVGDMPLWMLILFCMAYAIYNFRATETRDAKALFIRSLFS